MTIKHVKIEQAYSDDRGFLTPLIDEDKFKVKNVVYISSKVGVIRGNHYHKKESYWEYCTKGKFIYFEKDIKNPNSELVFAIVHEGEMVYSPAGIAHAIVTLEDTNIICIASRSRKKEAYEADLVKVKII